MNRFAPSLLLALGFSLFLPTGVSAQPTPGPWGPHWLIEFRDESYTADLAAGTYYFTAASIDRDASGEAERIEAKITLNGTSVYEVPRTSGFLQRIALKWGGVYRFDFVGHGWAMLTNASTDQQVMAQRSLSATFRERFGVMLWEGSETLYCLSVGTSSPVHIRVASLYERVVREYDAEPDPDLRIDLYGSLHDHKNVEITSLSGDEVSLQLTLIPECGSPRQVPHKGPLPGMGPIGALMACLFGFLARRPWNR